MHYSQSHYVTCVDLGAYGAIYMEGWQRQVKAIGAEAKKIKRYINCERIYPPQPFDKETLLAAGEPKYTAPQPS
ncbi:MAG: hypothetical protein GY821_04585 [Gammaproteobacteria bacterium]|nr:hypothetical protein [Gammaproteobacteria bacterium]